MSPKQKDIHLNIFVHKKLFRYKSFFRFKGEVMGTFQYTNELPSISWHHCCVKSGLCGKEFVNAKMS